MSASNIAALQTDLAAYRASPKEKAMLLLAEAATLDPDASADAVRRAVAAGWSNKQVADAIFFVSFFNMTTRIASAFALPPDAMHEFSPDEPLPLAPSDKD